MVEPHHTRKTRKRQKVVDESYPVLEKDDEERKLESLLFGVPYTTEGHELVVEINDDDDGDALDGSKELANLKDADVGYLNPF